MTSKDTRLQQIIDDAIDYIPNASVEIYDPREGLADATNALKQIYNARLTHFIKSKADSVAFVSRLAEFLKNENCTKPEIEEYKPAKRKPRSEESKAAAKLNAQLMWCPGGTMFMKQSADWQAKEVKDYEPGGPKHDRLKHSDVKAVYDAWKAGQSKKRTSVKK